MWLTPCPEGDTAAAMAASSFVSLHLNTGRCSACNSTQLANYRSHMQVKEEDIRERRDRESERADDKTNTTLFLLHAFMQSGWQLDMTNAAALTSFLIFLL